MPPPRPHESIPLRDTSLSPPTSPRAASTGRPRHHSRQSSTGYPPSASGSESWQARPSQQASRSSYYAADQTTGGRYRDEEAISQQQQQQHHQGSRGGRPPSARAAGGNGRRWDQEEDDSDDGYGAPEGGGEDDWDAYADFNNAGPRFSARPHLGPGIEGERFVANARNARSSRAMSTYTSTPSVYGGVPVGGGQPIIPPGGPNRMSSAGGSLRQYDSNTSLLAGRGMYPDEKKIGGAAASNMSESQRQMSELVTVPMLGADWKKSELHNLSRRGRKEERASRRDSRWKAFVRDEDRTRCCGRFSLRLVLVWAGFAAVIITALLVYFLLPRVPSFAFATKQPFGAVANATNTTNYISFSRTPANFDFNATLALQADTGAAYIPVHTTIDAKLFYIDEEKQVGTGKWNGTMPAKTLYDFQMPVRFHYNAINSSDTTWLDFYDACKHIFTGTERSTLLLRLELTLKARGRPGSTQTSTQISNIDCPYELPANGV